MIHKQLDLEALLEVPYVDPDAGFDISPDGKQVAFPWNPTGRWEIYMASLDNPTQTVQVTSGSGAKFAPRFSKDGNRLGYVLDETGGEQYDIWVLDLATGAHTNLTPDTPESIQPEFCWSPDGRRIAFASDRSGWFNAYVMPSSGGEARKVLSPPYPCWKVYWSPDGKWITVPVVAKGQDFYTYLVPFEGGEPFAISEGYEPLCAKDPAWSPDGNSLAFSSSVEGDYNIGLFDLDTRRVTWLTHGAGMKEYPTWSPDGKWLAYVSGNGPKNQLAVLDMDSKRITEYQVAQGVHYRPHFTPDGSQLIFIFDNPSHPDDLWRLSLSDGSFHQLTNSLPVSLQDASFTIPKEVQYPSQDGHMVPALLYQPADTAGLQPAIVYIHGGPNWLAQFSWDGLIQHMTSRGWVVLAPNYRGSIGYGQEWQLANRFDLGGNDTQDVVAGVEYLVRQGIADPKRIAVTGRSYGGYLTMTSLTRHPEKWRGGSAVVPFLNWFTGHENSREDLKHWDLENFGDPVKDYNLYYERSPFFFLEQINTPVQLICGAHDPRCPASESVQARDVLLAMNKPCDFVLYPDEGHVFLKIENVVDAKHKQVDFLAQILESDIQSDQ